MPFVLNTIYLFAFLFLSPWLLYKSLTTGKYRRGWKQKLFGQVPHRYGDKPCVWFHGVSVGEIHLLRPIVARFRARHPDWECVVSTTTDTGYDEAHKHFPALRIDYWPFDFSWAVHQALRCINPTLVILAEGELWPNFLTAAAQRGVAVMVVNGRLSPRSFRNWSAIFGKRSEFETRRVGSMSILFSTLLRWTARPLFADILHHVQLWAVQTKEIADRFGDLGVPAVHIHVTGSVKYDGVAADRHDSRVEAVRKLFSIQSTDLVWVAGSTQDPEEQFAANIFQNLRVKHPQLRLILVPRQKDRFDQVADLLARSNIPFIRRSNLKQPVEDRNAVVLVDTIGELAAIWGLADIAFVGGSLDGRRGGQNMIEPAAYGAAVLFGPHVWNFRDTAARLLDVSGARPVEDKASLECAVRELAMNAHARELLGNAARELVASQKGATEKTLDLIDQFLRHEATTRIKAA